MTAEGALGSTQVPWAMSGVVCPGGIRTSLDRAWGLDGREQPKASSQALQVVPLQDLFRLAQLGSRFRPGPASPHPQAAIRGAGFPGPPQQVLSPKAPEVPCVKATRRRSGSQDAFSLCFL